MFEHSIRVPRHYKVAANIFKKVTTEGGSVKSLLYDDKLRHFRTNVLFALITETVKHAADIDKIFEESKILNNESRLDPWLAKVLTAELLFGKKTLPGISKPEKTILAYKEQFEKYTTEHEAELKTEVVQRPRYVRINTNLLSTSDAIRSFQDEGYRFIRCTAGSYNDYLQQIKGLTEYDFTQDYHVKTVFVFPHGTKLHEHELYLANQIILQDKATAMAVHLLAPPSGSVVLDMCAAPGMKTTQVAAYMRNEGKVIAVERNEKRFKTLTDFVNKTGCKCVELIHKDVFEIRRGDHDDVEYVLLDPSCSGSGMEFTVHNYIEDTRLAKLTSLQEKFLKHAMNAFPKAKKIVYSTCSLFPEENERVITNVVKNSRAKWRVLDVKELLKCQWNNFGSGMYGSMGTRCLYAKPESDLTTGFFLAVLEREPVDLDKNTHCEANNVSEKNNSNDFLRKSNRKKKTECVANNIDDKLENPTNIEKNKRKKRKILENNNDVSTGINESKDDSCVNNKKQQMSAENDIEAEVLLNDVVDVTDKKKKKKHRELPDCTEINMSVQEDQEGEYLSINKKAKKHKTKRNIENHLLNAYVNEEVLEDNTNQSRKKKKKKKKYSDSDESVSKHMEQESNVSVVDINNCEDDKNNVDPPAKKKKRDKKKLS